MYILYIYTFNSSYIFKTKAYRKLQSYQNYIHVKLET